MTNFRVFRHTPSISNSGDSLFFGSDRPGPFGGMDVWMSERSNGIWGEPVNLGSPVNSPDNERSPHFSANSGLLFFEKNTQTAFSQIYMCESLGNNNWSTPNILPEVINVPGEPAFGPFFDETNQVLYYSNLNFETTLMKKIAFLNGLWGAPETLSENVNGFFWGPNYCNFVLTSDASQSSDGNLLFYGKEIWEISWCIDFTNFLFVSHKIITKIEERNIHPEVFQITVYPNPSNNLFRFVIKGSVLRYNLEIFNIEGKLIRNFNNVKSHTFEWDCKNEMGKIISSGIYFAVVSAEYEDRVVKLMFIK